MLHHILSTSTVSTNQLFPRSIFHGVGFANRALEVRKQEAEKTLTKYPSKLPIVVERYRGEKSIPQIDKVSLMDRIYISSAKLDNLEKYI